MCMCCFCIVDLLYIFVFFFKLETAYDMRISDWSSDVCSSDLSFAAWEHLRLQALLLRLRRVHPDPRLLLRRSLPPPRLNFLPDHPTAAVQCLAPRHDLLPQ